MSSPQPETVGREAPPGDGGRDQALWETLDALDRLTEVTPSSGWDQAVKVLAARVSAGLVDRLGRIEAEETVARCVPCANPYCRYKVLVTNHGATHIHNDGTTFGATIGRPIRDRDDRVEWVAHTAEPADEHRQAQRRAIVESATACTHPHCNHPVAVVDGVAHHIDGNGTLFGPRISVAVPAPIHVPDTDGEDGEGEGEAEHWTWVRHTAEPAPGEGLGDPPSGPADATGALEERPALGGHES